MLLIVETLTLTRYKKVINNKPSRDIPLNKSSSQEQFSFLRIGLISATLFLLHFSNILRGEQEWAPHVLQANFYTEANQAIIFDLTTNTVLFEKASDAQMAPSSMTKILLVYMVFEKIKNGELRLDDTVVVDKQAWRIGGSRMFLNIGERVTIDQLLRGIIVQSGNDAALALAKKVWGSEKKFCEAANRRIRQLGACATNFLNATGWPDKGHTSTARDILMMGIATIKDHPEFYRAYYSQREFTHNNIRQFNRNPLVHTKLGDGIKTGQTNEGGFGLIGSCEKNGRRIIFVINGLSGHTERKAETNRVVNWAFENFEILPMFKATTPMHHAYLENVIDPIPLKLSRDVVITIPRQERNQIVRTVVYKDIPLRAPLKAETEVAHLMITFPSGSCKFPLVTTRDVHPDSHLMQLWYALKRFLGLSPKAQNISS
jgi:D-alanyl-D-alanine carboxypeptidase (penicillin-binding protein 5/6)